MILHIFLKDLLLLEQAKEKQDGSRDTAPVTIQGVVTMPWTKVTAVEIIRKG